MNDEINKLNIEADRLTFGKWSKRNDQFAETEPLRILYEMFEKANMDLPDDPKVIEYGSADGIVGEYFRERLAQDGYNPQLTILDAVKENLDANTNPETRKVQINLLDLNVQNEYDLGLVRSVFHYFVPDAQKYVAKNIYNSLKPGGYLLSQNFIQPKSDLELYLRINRMIGKYFQIEADEGVITKMFSDTGFAEVRKLGDMPVWEYTSENLKTRYDLNDSNIQEMRQLILDTPEPSRRGFRVTETGFVLPVPYKVFLMRRPLGS